MYRLWFYSRSTEDIELASESRRCDRASRLVPSVRMRIHFYGLCSIRIVSLILSKLSRINYTGHTILGHYHYNNPYLRFVSIGNHGPYSNVIVASFW